MESAKERELLKALVGDEHRDLYLTNAWFKSAVDGFVRFLPALVTGLAVQAEAMNEKFQKALEAVQNVPSLASVFPSEDGEYKPR